MAKRIVSAVALVCVLAVAVPVAAQTSSWYAGAELGAARVEFRPYYQYPVGTPDQYFDRASGMEVAFFAAREWALAPRLRLGALARFAYGDARWTLGITTGEHSTFTYRLGPSVAISAAPAFRISERVWLTGEVGTGAARVTEEKISIDSTHYLAQPWTQCYVVAVGGRMQLARRVSGLISYRFQRSASFTYRSFLPDGRQWETISDNPVVGRLSAGLAYWF